MKKIGKFLMIAAVVLFIILAAFRLFLTHQQQDRLDLLTPQPTRIESEYNGDVQNVSEMDVINADNRLIIDYGIGRIDCDEIGLHTAIMEGSTDDLLQVGAGTMKPNQEVGKGNYALAGHNMMNRNLLFGSLRYAEVGQVIDVEAYGEKASYTITETTIVEPSAVHVIEDTEGEGLLTLVTCNATGDKRLIIRGTLVT
ncbi:class A sortase [Enterococcus sp. LJL90]